MWPQAHWVSDIQHSDLSQVLLICPRRFDETEYIITPPPDSSVAKYPVFFSGVLRIESLGWLTEQGLHYLETDLKNYDRKIHMEHSQTGLTLKSLYGSIRRRIKVEVVYEKVMLAAYLTCERPLIKMIIQ